MIFVCCFLAACSPDTSDVKVGEARSVENYDASSNPDLDDATRYGYRLTENAPSASMAGGGQVPASASPSSLSFSLPEGWEEIEATALRNPNFAVTDSPAIEAYVTMIPGTAGGMISNYNRWRRQIGLDPLEDLAALETVEVLGEQTPLLDVEGSYSGMGTQAIDDYRLLGLAVPMGSMTVFVKMTGPAADVQTQKAQFLELIASFEPAEGGADANPHAGMDMSMGSSGMSMGGAMTNPHGDMTNPEDIIDPSQLTWTKPVDWTPGRESSMRIASYSMADANVDCSVFLLPGEAGGIIPNLNRWRGQLALDPLSPDEADQLETVEVLGQSAVFMEADGSFTDTMMGGGTISEATMFAVICPLEGQSMFIKMTGPREIMHEQKSNFISFCQSFRVK